MIEDIDEKTKKPVGKYRPKVEFTDINSETGLQFTSQLAPEDVVKRMKELPEYGNLFKSGNVAGIGATITTGGLSPGGVGGVDVRRLASDPRAYRELRKNNPALISAIGKK